MFLEEINSAYSQINPNKMICRIKWKECTGKFTLIAGIQGYMLIFRDKSFVVCQIFAAGANPAQKLVTTSQTSHEIRPVQLQVKSEFLEDASSQNKCHAEGHVTTRNKTTVCVHVYDHTQHAYSGMESKCSYREHWPIVTLLCCYG